MSVYPSEPSGRPLTVNGDHPRQRVRQHRPAGRRRRLAVPCERVGDVLDAGQLRVHLHGARALHVGDDHRLLTASRDGRVCARAHTAAVASRIFGWPASQSTSPELPDASRHVAPRPPAAPPQARRPDRLGRRSSSPRCRSPPASPRTCPAAGSTCPARSRPRSPPRSSASPASPQAQLAAVLVPAPGARPEQLGAAVDRVARGRRTRRRRLARPAPPASRRSPRRAPAARSSCRCAPRSTRTPPPRSPPTCATGSAVADGVQDGVATHLVGQGALWAGDAGAVQGGPGQGGVGRLPGRAADPAVRVRLAGRRGAAARARVRLRARHRRADLRALAGDGDVGLRDQHGVDDRHRRGGRLLAVHRRPLPRGDRGRPRARATRARWRWPRPASPCCSAA